MAEPESAGRLGTAYLAEACEVEYCDGATAFLGGDEAEFCLSMNIASSGPYPYSKSVGSGEMVVTRTAEPDRYIALGCNTNTTLAAHKAHYEEMYAGAAITFTKTQSDNKCQATGNLLHGDASIVKCNYGTFNKGPWKYCHEVSCMNPSDKCLSIDFDGDYELWTSGFGCVRDPTATCDSHQFHDKFAGCNVACATAGAACNVCVSGAFDKPAPSGIAMGILAVALVGVSWLTSN